METTKTFVVGLLCCFVLITATWASQNQLAKVGVSDQFSSESIHKEVSIPIQSGAEIETGDCSDYIDLSGQPLPISVTGTTVGATNNYGPFQSYPPYWQGYWDNYSCAGRDKTYKWTVPAGGRYTISLCGSSYDTGLLLYNFTCPTEPTYPVDFIYGCDDACGVQSELYCLAFSTGQEILIVVDGYGNWAGAYQLHISEYHPAADLDSFIDSTMAVEHIPGLAACAIYDGDIIWSGNYGYADIARQIAPTDLTLFLMASISKTFVGVALMQLWEQGLFNLDDDINRYLPWEVHNPSYPASTITFRMLMSHTSAIADNWAVMDSLYTWGGDSPIPLEEFLRNYLTPGGSYYYPGVNFGNYTPGTVFNYCSVGATLAGYLVERINPQSLSFAEYCQEHIFAPLSMNNTSWFLANLNIDDIAIPYHWTGSNYSPYQHYGVPYYPAAQLRTSTNQLARHLIAFMQHGQIEGTRILDNTTVDLMTTVQIQAPGFSGNGTGLFWFTFILGGRLLWGHAGNSEGCRTYMYFCPEENTGAIVLTNGESPLGCRVILNELFEYAAQYTGGLNTVENLVIQRSGSNVILTWSPVLSATGYRIYRSNEPDDPMHTGILIGTAIGPTFTDSNALQGRVQAFYVVTAIRE
jgi:CubicO group peptidase (beta-lactamase class C family)